MPNPSLASLVAPHLSHDPILRRIVECIPKLGLKSRKTLLAICQTSISSEDSVSVNEAIQEIRQDMFIRGHDGVPSLYDFRQFSVHIANRGIYRSFISMFVRSEVLDTFSGASEAIQEGFAKEFNASQNERPKEHRISYQCLDLENYHPDHYSIYYVPKPWWLGHAKAFVHRFTRRLSNLHVIYPQVQRRKNMSTDSCRNLVESGYTTLDWRGLRTLDLELHKMKTGIAVEGNCEMRMAWRFNELKPRFYYCQGASNYWSSRYMKRIAVEMMESVTSTTLQRRSHPEDIQYSLQEDHWLTLWDLTSFTTTLSELKHFLYYVGMNLKDSLLLQQKPLDLLDYAEGIIQVPAHELLLQYNQAENQGAPFSVWRVCQVVFNQFEETETFTQKNSGMLGVAGNIGLSTAFHGFHLEAAVEKDTGCSVGDDALGGTDEDPRRRLIPHIGLIGEVHPEKASILPPIAEHEFEQAAKFIKRRFSRTHHGIVIGLLFAFPSLADVFEIRDEYHTLRNIEANKQIAKFVSQVGSLFWDIHAAGELVEEEHELLTRVLMMAYRKLDLSFHGSLPGVKHAAFADHMMLAVPSLFVDFVHEDWSEHLWDHSQQQWAILPQTLGPLSIPPYELGLEFNLTEGAMANVLEDIGCVKQLRMLTELVEVCVTNRRCFQSFMTNSRRSFRYRYDGPPPKWFDDVFTQDLNTFPIFDVV